MRTINIIPDTYTPCVWGYVGENNQTMLCITVPQDIADAEQITAELSSFNGSEMITDPLTVVDGKVSFKIGKALTRRTIQYSAGSITVQLVGYVLSDGERIRVGKSPRFSGQIGSSVNAAASAESEAEPSLIEKLIAKIHSHFNKKTLDGLKCLAAESEFITDSTDSGYLKYNNTPLRYCTDGAVISAAQEVTKSGKKYLRLMLNREPINISNVPDCVDIPVSAISNVEDGGLEFTLNGVELDFGTEDAIQDSHTHSNKAGLDSLSDDICDAIIGLFSDEYKMVIFDELSIGATDGNALPLCEGLPVVAYATMPTIRDGVMYPFIDYQLDISESITVTRLAHYQDIDGHEVDAPNCAEEYTLSFISGDTPTVISLPASVKWANELTVEPNKKYQISIVDNIALWTAVEVST